MSEATSGAGEARVCIEVDTVDGQRVLVPVAEVVKARPRLTPSPLQHAVPFDGELRVRVHGMTVSGGDGPEQRYVVGPASGDVTLDGFLHNRLPDPITGRHIEERSVR